MEYTCGTCGDKVPGDLVVFMDHTNEHIFDEVKKKHPEWKDEDGLCLKCVDYVKSQIHGESS